jgi:hypothetical protein
VKCAVALFAFLILAIAAPSASGAEFGIVPGSFKARLLDAEGQQETRAGSHPDRLQIDFALNVEGTGTSPRDFAFELPPGFGGRPGAVPECPRETFEKKEECPAESQVGKLTFKTSGGAELTLPVFDLEPAPGQIIAFTSLPAVDVPMTMELRPDDFGTTFKASDLPEAPLSEGHVELWGVPADHQSGTGIPRRPFLTAPARCGPLVFGFRTRSWEVGAPWLSAATETESPLTGCQSLAFEPQLGMQLGDAVADSPTGARIDLSMQEGDDPDGLANAQIKDATIELPEGLTVSPGGAAGITACTDAQFGLGTSTPASCPPSSRVGGMEIASTELPEPLLGDVYIGEGIPGERLRLFVVAVRPGVVAKFISLLHADPATGRLSTVLKDMPQLPLSRLTLSIDGGPRALLASPLTCGTFPSTATLESYGGGASVESSAAVVIGAGANGSPCRNPAAFSPSLVTTAAPRAAGRSTTFSMTLLRRAGEQLTSRFAVSLPMGLSAALGGIERCSDAAAASGSCPAGSRIGEAAANVGSGSSTIALHGDVYAAGAYRQAPFSMIIALHASIGPFDLGATTTRAAVQINSRTGRVTVVTDSLPGLVEGLPVRIQSIAMTLNRPGVIRNPTSCAPAVSDATFEASSGASATATSSFPVKSCKRLGFAPSFSIALGGRSELHRHGNPSLHVVGRFRQADTNLRAMQLVLPKGLQFETSGLREICPRQDAVDGLCSAKALVGRADARSPMLSSPLKGSIYVVQPKGNGLPDLWIRLGAMGVHMDLRGRTFERDGRFVTSLVGLPDMPLSAFAMRLRGGKRGVVSLNSDPCDRSQASQLGARLFLEGQNGSRRALRPRARSRCGEARANRLG